MSNKIFFALAIFLFLINVCPCDAETANLDVKISVPAVMSHNNIVFARYDTWPQAELKMDIYAVNDNKKHPAVILIPGGAWVAAPREVVQYIAFKLAENNFVAAGIEYRLIGGVNYVDVIGDVKAAVRYIKANADKFNIDKDKIAVMGFSAGGYLANMLGVTGSIDKFNFGDNLDQSSEVQAVIDCFGITDFTRTADDYSDEKRGIYYSPSSFLSLFVNGVAGIKNHTGGGILANHETAQDANVLNYIDKNTPPFLIFHGNADKTVSLSQSQILYDELVKNKIPADFYIINGGEHDAVYFHQPEVFKIILDFLNKVFK